MPLFEIGFKEAVDNENLLQGQILSEILLEMIFGESTEFYQRLYNEGVINSTFGYEVMSGDGYFVNILGGEAPDPQRVYDEVTQEIERVKAEGLSEELFEIVKKSFYGGRVSRFNSVEHIATGMLASHFAGCDAFDSLNFIKQVKFEDIEKRLKQQLFEEYSSISVITPM